MQKDQKDKETKHFSSFFLRCLFLFLSCERSLTQPEFTDLKFCNRKLSNLDYYFTHF